MKTVTFQMKENRIRNHPTLRKMDKRKAKRIAKRYAKMGVKTFVTSEMVMSEVEEC